MALAPPAQASGYSDFNQGLEAGYRGDADAEIAGFSRALADGDLPESMKPAALYDRGVAYEHEKKYAEAIADFSAVIALKPDYREAYSRRARSSAALGKYDAASQDCEQVTSLQPDSAVLAADCGRLAFLAGRFEQASNHFQHAFQLDQHRRQASYDLLWLGLTGLRTGQTAAAKMGAAAQSVDRGEWPWPLIAFFLGGSAEATLQAAASTGDPATRQGQQCEVGFYLGEWKLAYQDRGDAKSLFQQAVKLCPDNFIELEPAKAELAKLQKGDAQ
jgi:lipoprotein NlpI